MSRLSVRQDYRRDAMVLWDTHPNRLLDAWGSNVYKFIQDFGQPPVLSAADTLLGWTTTLVEAGAGESTVTEDDLEGGVLLLTTDAAEDDGITLQADNRMFKLVDPVEVVYFGVRLKMSDATQSDLLVGLGVADTTPLGGIADAVFFDKVDGATAIRMTTEKGSTRTNTTAAAVFAADTYKILEFYADILNSRIYFYIDGVREATHTANIPNDTILTPTIQFLAGAAAAKTLRWDWIRCIAIGGRDDQT